MCDVHVAVDVVVVVVVDVCVVVVVVVVVVVMVSAVIVLCVFRDCCVSIVSWDEDEGTNFVAFIPVQFLRFSNNYAKLKIITRNYHTSPEKNSFNSLQQPVLQFVVVTNRLTQDQGRQWFLVYAHHARSV